MGLLVARRRRLVFAVWALRLAAGLREHLSHCVTQALTEDGDTATVKVREASDTVARLVRS